MNSQTPHPPIVSREEWLAESLTDTYRLLDTTPYGRQQEFEDSPTVGRRSPPAAADSAV
jgi:hypothetical protein